MQSRSYFCCLSLVTLLAAIPAIAEQAGNEPLQVTAREIASFEAPKSGLQGVAVDAGSYYVVSDSVITKHDKKTGRLQTSWSEGAAIGAEHLNSCKVYYERLVCANSNFPDVPMASSVEVFDRDTLQHIGTHSMGISVGSLTWIDRIEDSRWWAGFAQYSDEGGTPGRDTSWSSIETFDSDWRRTGGYIFPPAVVERMAPFSASGGAWGPDGLLYITGHDLPEMYVLRLPKAGSILEHVATIAIAAEGQAFAWDHSEKRRIVYAVSRGSAKIKVFEIPEVTLVE